MKGKLIFVSLVLILITSLVIVGCQAPAPTPTPTPTPTPATETIKIGISAPLTGNMAMAGDRMAKGAKFAFEQAGFQVAGKKIELVIEDDKDTGEGATDAARKMVEQDKVALVIGPTGGAPGMAAAGYFDKVGIPNLHCGPSPITIFLQKWKWTIQVGGAEPQCPSSMARYCYEQLGYRNMTVAASDFTPGHLFVGAFTAEFKKLGGTIVQEQYPPYNCPDYSPYLGALKDADAFGAWFSGSDSIRFFTQFDELGLTKKIPIVGVFHGAFFAPFIISALPPAVAETMIGRVFPGPYSALLDNPANKSFVEAYQKKYNLIPDDTDEGRYLSGLLTIAALKATNGDTTPETLRQALLNVQLEGPEGLLTFDKERASAMKNIYIFKIDKINGAFSWVPVYTYKNVPSLGFINE